MFLDSAILGVLAAGPRHGYAIVKTLDGALHGISAVNRGQVYATLARLARDGLIACAPPPSPAARGARAASRRHHALEPQGRRALRGWLDRPLGPAARSDPFVDELAARTWRGDAAAIARLLAARRARCLALLAALPADGAGSALHLRAARRHLAAELAWLGRAADLLVGAPRARRGRALD